MVYNYNYPMGYQPMQYSYQQPQQMSYAPQPQPQNGIVWVQGESGAKAYPVAAGSNVLLMDSESECFYIKSTDVSGMPLPLRIFEYKEVIKTQQPQQSHTSLPDMQMYAKKEELEALKKQVDAMQSRGSYSYEDVANE